MERHFFLTTYGCQGRASFLDNTARKYRDIIRLNGYPRQLAAGLIRECYSVAKQGHIEIEIIHNALDNSPEGILFPELGTGLVNLPLYEMRYDLSALFKNESLSLCSKHLSKATDYFSRAKVIHDDWEKIYIEKTDFNALNRLSDDTIQLLIGMQKTDYHGNMCDRFFGAATINGSTDYIDTLTEGTKRYLIKGRPGTGKSTFLKKLAQAAFDNGFHVERYHCAFDPNSLDMVIIRELKLCLFDSTSPHEYFPSKESDEILDFYAAAVHQDTDTVHKKELAEISGHYKKNIEHAIGHLIAANDACLQAEATYEKQINKDTLMTIRKNILQRLFP